MAKKSVKNLSHSELKKNKKATAQKLIFVVILLSSSVLLCVLFFIAANNLFGFTFLILAFGLFLAGITLNVMKTTIEEELTKRKTK